MADATVELAEKVGEISAQVRELIHDNNNRIQHDQAVATALIKLEGLPQQIKEMGEKIDVRLKALEDDHVRRQQTASIGGLVLRSPLIAWMITGLAFLIALIKGWIRIDG